MSMQHHRSARFAPERVWERVLRLAAGLIPLALATTAWLAAPAVAVAAPAPLFGGPGADVHGFSADEVCDMLQVTPGNQRVLHHRGPSRIRSLLERYLSHQ